MVKIYLFTLILTVGVFSTRGQSKCNDTIEVFSSPEELPVFDIKSPGLQKLLEYVSEKLEYPETAKTDVIEGTVWIQFWISEDGITSEHKVLKSIREDLDKEALRVAKLIKFDTPAMNRGKPIGTCYNIPISFKFSDDIIKSSWKNKPKRKKE